MSRIIFIRHGETEWNAESRLQGQLDVELSALGEAQAEVLSKTLEGLDFDRVYSSPLRRALDTANKICRGRIVASNIRSMTIEKAEMHVPCISSALSEIYLGSWQGHTVDEVKKKFAEEYKIFKNTPECYESEEQETLQEIGERFSTFIKEIMGHENKRYCIVSHGTIMRAGLAKLVFGDVKYMNNLVFENGSITEIDFHQYNGEITPVIYKLNDTGHLSGLNSDRPTTAILMGVI